jgi:hypothetical protein
MNLRSKLAAAAIACGLCSAAYADVTGKVTFDGKVPARKQVNLTGNPQCAAMHKQPLIDEGLIVGKDNAIANVVVSIKNAPAGAKAPADPVYLDQKECRYQPHVIAIMIGTPLLVKNSDPFLHNVHGLPQDNKAFNFGQPNIDPGRKITGITTPESFRVKCDVHPWMSAAIAAFDHPYFAVTGEDGTFAIKSLPDGDYEVVFWHEKLGEVAGKVSVKGGKGEVSAKMKPEEEGAARPALREIVVSADGPATCCEK